MGQKRLLKLALRLAYIAGANPFVNDLFGKISAWFILFCAVTLCPLVLIKMFSEFNDVDVLVPTFESMMSLSQLLMKHIFCLNYRNAYSNLLTKMDKRFWKIEDYNDRILIREVKKLENIFYLAGMTYFLGGVILCIAFAIKPFFTSGRNLPLLCWTPEGNPTPFYEILFVMHAYIVLILIPVVGAFDLSYTAINIGIAVQFKILRYELENLVEEDDNNTALKLKKCVQHHQLLLDCCDELMEMCSLLLLSQYFIFIITICMELYSLTESNDDAKVINCFIYLCQVGIEAGLICITPAILEDESSQIATAAYLSKWDEIKSREICTDIGFIIMRAQSGVQFNAGGLFAMNVECLKNICSSGVSFYTLMKNRKNA